MCDTMVVPASFTRDGHVFFAKNSDRHPNEAQYLQIIPATDHPADSRVNCTYIDIPQVRHTFRVLLSRPFWMWGCEMGANENGVVIGNEAVFTRVPYRKSGGLLGMDLIRLALERSEDAEAAVGVIVKLLETHGQGGNAGYGHAFYYHNSFLIADINSIWLLETAGEHWAAKRIRGIYAISNALTIENDFDLASSNLVNHAIERGWCKDKKSFNFAKNYSDPLMTYFGAAASRRSCSLRELQSAKAGIDLRHMMAALQSHGVPVRDYHPERGLTGASVCMHAGFGPVRANQSVGSLVADLSDKGTTYWLTGTSAPCTSLFKPVWLAAGMPEEAVTPKGKYDRFSAFWQHELLHRSLLKNYAARYPLIHDTLADQQEKFIMESVGITRASEQERYAYTRESMLRSLEIDRDLLKIVKQSNVAPTGYLYQRGWQKFNADAQISEYLV